MINLGAITGISFTPDACMIYGCTDPACFYGLCAVHIGRLRVPILKARMRSAERRREVRVAPSRGAVDGRLGFTTTETNGPRFAGHESEALTDSLPTQPEGAASMTPILAPPCTTDHRLTPSGEVR